MAEIGKRIVYLIERVGVLQFARAAGIAPITAQSYLRASRSTALSVHSLLVLSRLSGVSLDWIANGDAQ